MTKRPEYLDGAPCWADLSTPNFAGAQRFYGELFGWTFDASRPDLGGYTNVRKDGALVAGVMPSQPGHESFSAWGVYFQTGDIEVAARKIAGAGGKVVMAPLSVMGLGHMMLATDPTGALFGLWQPGEHRGAERIDESGAMCWHELYTRDGRAADRFYREVLGHEPARHPGESSDCPGTDYMLYRLGGREVCGRMQMTDAWGDAPPHWLTYFGVEDIDAALAKVRSLDGKLLHGPMDTPYGKIATVGDPYGAVFALVQPAATA